MSVIINQFEIDLKPADDDQKTESTTDQPPAPPEITPLDLKDVWRWEDQRMNRLRAH